MTSAEFTQHIRFSLLHLYEVSVLDKGPGRSLTEWLDSVYQTNEQQSYGHRLHMILTQTIECMKPPEPVNANIPRHRTYLILKRRYLDGVPIQQLEVEFNCSSRQFRRDNHRALEELVLILWNLSTPRTVSVSKEELMRDHLSSDMGQIAEADDERPVHHVTGINVSTTEAFGESTMPTKIAEFSRSISANNLLDIVVDAAQTLSVIINTTHTQLTVDIPSDLPLVAADRVALRLALIKVLRLAIAHAHAHSLRIHSEALVDGVNLFIDGIDAITRHDPILNEAQQLFTLAQGTLSTENLPGENDLSGSLHLVVKLTTFYRPTVLVIDDDPSMPRIIQRFLALKPVKVVGCTSSDNVLKLVREVHPVLILLDVLMPKRDGWEVLQELKANPDTYHISLAICSIWDERELAISLGADMFFQKPIERADLLSCVEKHLQPFAVA